MARKYRDLDDANRTWRNNLDCRDRAERWGMTESARHWQQEADQANAACLRFVEEETAARRRTGR